MKSRVAVRLAALVGSCLLGSSLIFSTGAAAAEKTAKPDIDAQAWYVVSPSLCTLPVGCPPEPLPQAVSVYPKGTLHVSADQGQPSAVAYIKPDLFTIPAGVKLVSGRLTLPVTADLDHGNVQVENAEIVACLVTSPITDGVEGGLGEAPTYDCAQSKAPAKATKDARSFTVDLAPFLQAWSSGLPALGAALVPSPEQAADATWGVTFNGKDAEGTPRASFVVSFERTRETSTPGTDSPPVSSPPPVGSGPIDVPAPVAGPEIGEAPEGVGPPPAAEPNPELAPQQPIAAPRLVNMPWYTYDGVVYLPLVLLVGMALIARVLTRPLKPRPLPTVR